MHRLINNCNILICLLYIALNIMDTRLINVIIIHIIIACCPESVHRNEPETNTNLNRRNYIHSTGLGCNYVCVVLQIYYGIWIGCLIQVWTVCSAVHHAVFVT